MLGKSMLFFLASCLLGECLLATFFLGGASCLVGILPLGPSFVFFLFWGSLTDVRA